MLRYRCHTGHAYTTSSLLASITTAAEEELWKAMQNMEATTMLLNQIANHYKANGNASAADMFRQKAKLVAVRARILHDFVFTQELMSEDIRLNKD